MITSIVVGSGNKRTVVELPAYNDRKRTVQERIALGNKIKSGFLFPNGKGFKQAKARGERAKLSLKF